MPTGKNNARTLVSKWDKFGILRTVKPVTQPAGYTRFHGLEGRVKFEGGLYSRAGNSSKIV